MLLCSSDATFQRSLFAKSNFIPDCFFNQVTPKFWTYYISNGPLLIAIVAWRNSLVFHDLDKLTSVFIHLFPALVTFAMRWYPPNGNLVHICQNVDDCSVSVFNVFALSFASYTIWQVMYLLKTEVIDKDRLLTDSELMTSARWMSEYRPVNYFYFLTIFFSILCGNIL